eukprot:PhM_4_TR18071/c0_g1_i2/m.44723
MSGASTRRRRWADLQHRESVASLSSASKCRQHRHVASRSASCRGCCAQAARGCCGVSLVHRPHHSNDRARQQPRSPCAAATRSARRCRGAAARTARACGWPPRRRSRCRRVVPLAAAGRHPRRATACTRSAAQARAACRTPPGAGRRAGSRGCCLGRCSCAAACARGATRRWRPRPCLARCPTATATPPDGGGTTSTPPDDARARCRGMSSRSTARPSGTCLRCTFSLWAPSWCSCCVAPGGAFLRIPSARRRRRGCGRTITRSFQARFWCRFLFLNLPAVRVMLRLVAVAVTRPMVTVMVRSGRKGQSVVFSNMAFAATTAVAGVDASTTQKRR